MRIKEIVSQYRNDFSAILVCEHCSHEENLSSGYDDSYYHNVVIPGFHCFACGKDRKGDGE